LAVQIALLGPLSRRDHPHDDDALRNLLAVS
jgi:hypothetical protein